MGYCAAERIQHARVLAGAGEAAKLMVEVVSIAQGKLRNAVYS